MDVAARALLLLALWLVESTWALVAEDVRATPTLRDTPVIGSAPTKYLDGTWTASGAGLQIPAQVPGDLISDLHAAGVIGNPLYELNFLNSSIWHDNTWTYSYTFDLDLDPGSTADLVFDGVKMGARVRLNGRALGVVSDQFLRYSFPLDAAGLLRSTGNLLEVTFDKFIPTHGRFMACTGGWDWAPYTSTWQEGARTFTKGIWKSVYVVISHGVTIQHFVPHVFYDGAYPVEPLTDGAHAGFTVRARVHFAARQAVSGNLTVTGEWGQTVSTHVDLPAGESNVTLSLRAAADAIKLWWPTGAGAQNLHGITARFEGVGGMVSTGRQIGFRFAALVTGNDTDPGQVKLMATEEGSGSHGMYFRVNGALVFSRGANMIPMEEMEGWMDAEAHAAIVQSAADANFNTLRVWGGGIFLPDIWYDMCDRLGILVYHDMQYAQYGHGPGPNQWSATSEQVRELRHQVRRLSHHASIIVWDSCNECGGEKEEDKSRSIVNVMTVVAEEDESRSIWPSSPGRGWTTGVHKLTAMPNGKRLATRPIIKKEHEIETHGSYRAGSGFPAVNGAIRNVRFASNIPIEMGKLKFQQEVGPHLENVFASEFGAVSMSSFESMAPTLDPKHWGLHGGQPWAECSGREADCKGPNVMAQRNHPCDGLITVYFGKSEDLNATGEEAFKRQLYQCMISQALAIKQDIETRRGSNTFGVLVWQFNEIWPTGGWGSVEYGNPKFEGQVLGGRWKPLQYWYRSSIFADVMATCGLGGRCYVRNDSPMPFVGKVSLSATDLTTGCVVKLLEFPVSLAAGAGTLQWFHSDEVLRLNETAAALEIGVISNSGTLVSNNLVALATPEKLVLRNAKVSVSARVEPDGSLIADVRTDEVAMYVTLTTKASGRFEDNAFLLRPPGRAVRFLPALRQGGPGNLTASFAASLRVEDLSAYRTGIGSRKAFQSRAQLGRRLETLRRH